LATPDGGLTDPRVDHGASDSRRIVRGRRFTAFPRIYDSPRSHAGAGFFSLFSSSSSSSSLFLSLLSFFFREISDLATNPDQERVAEFIRQDSPFARFSATLRDAMHRDALSSQFVTERENDKKV